MPCALCAPAVQIGYLKVKQGEKGNQCSKLSIKGILVTQADTFMGPAICESLQAQGADVLAHIGPMSDPGERGKIVAGAGKIDVLVANLAIGLPSTATADVTDK